jgi:hypothetical protein
MDRARKNARDARNRRDQKLAYHYTQVALHIARNSDLDPTIQK